jgi:putative AlgH/UPF0301 family transcriptional regulator
MPSESFDLFSSGIRASVTVDLCWVVRHSFRKDLLVESLVAGIDGAAMHRRRLRLLIVLVTALVFVGFRRNRSPELEIRESAFRTKSETGPVNLLPVGVVPTQSKNPDNLGTGKILVASRNLADPHFAQTVVLLLHYDAEGAAGLILNRRTDVPLAQGLDGVEGAKGRKDPIFIGGPVGSPGLCALIESAKEIENAEHVFNGIYLISAKTAFEKALKSHPAPNVFHVYLGYAGWTKDQLEMEVKLGAWFIFPADESTVFNPNPDTLWQQMIRRTELKVARYPAKAYPGGAQTRSSSNFEDLGS